MKVAELKRLVTVGTMLRLVKTPHISHRIDRMRVVAVANAREFATDGEGLLERKGPSYTTWPKAAELQATPNGFICHAHLGGIEFEWVDPANPTPKDKAAIFILNTFEHCMDDTDAILALGEVLGNHEAATEVIKGWFKLKPELVDALLKPAPCDRHLRAWLDTAWDWTEVPVTLDV